MNELQGKGGIIMSRLYELFYELRSEMNKENRGFFSEKEIAIQAFEDVESINDKAYIYDLLNELDLDNYKGILNEISSLSRVFFRELVLARKCNFVIHELARLLRAIDDSIYSVGFKTKSGDEFVIIQYSNSYVKEIVVTGDGKAALCRDVLANM